MFLLAIEQANKVMAEIPLSLMWLVIGQYMSGGSNWVCCTHYGSILSLAWILFLFF